MLGFLLSFVLSGTNLHGYRALTLSVGRHFLSLSVYTSASDHREGRWQQRVWAGCTAVEENVEVKDFTHKHCSALSIRGATYALGGTIASRSCDPTYDQSPRRRQQRVYLWLAKCPPNNVVRGAAAIRCSTKPAAAATARHTEILRNGSAGGTMFHIRKLVSLQDQTQWVVQYRLIHMCMYPRLSRLTELLTLIHIFTRTSLQLARACVLLAPSGPYPML